MEDKLFFEWLSHTWTFASDEYKEMAKDFEMEKLCYGGTAVGCQSEFHSLHNPNACVHCNLNQTSEYFPTF